MILQKTCFSNVYKKNKRKTIRPKQYTLHVIRNRSCSLGVPLLCIEDGEHVLAGHEAFFHIPDLQVVQGQHVFLLFLLQIKHQECQPELQ